MRLILKLCIYGIFSISIFSFCESTPSTQSEEMHSHFKNFNDSPLAIMDETGIPLQPALFGTHENNREFASRMGRYLARVPNTLLFAHNALGVIVGAPFLPLHDTLLLATSLPFLASAWGAKTRYRLLGKMGNVLNFRLSDLQSPIVIRQFGRWETEVNAKAIPIHEIISENGPTGYVLPRKALGTLTSSLLAPLEWLEAIRDPKSIFKIISKNGSPIVFKNNFEVFSPSLEPLDLINKAIKDSPLRRALVANLYQAAPHLFPKDYWKELLFGKFTQGPDYADARRLALGILLQNSPQELKESMIASSLLDPSPLVRKYGVEQSLTFTFQNRVLDAAIDSFLRKENGHLQRHRENIRLNQERIFTFSSANKSILHHLDSDNRTTRRSLFCRTFFASLSRGIIQAPVGVAAGLFLSYLFRAEIAGLILGAPAVSDTGILLDPEFLKDLSEKTKWDPKKRLQIIENLTKRISGKNLDFKQLVSQYLAPDADPEDLGDATRALTKALANSTLDKTQALNPFFPISASKFSDRFETNSNLAAPHQREKSFLLAAALRAHGIEAVVRSGINNNTGEHHFWVFASKEHCSYYMHFNKNNLPGPTEESVLADPALGVVMDSDFYPSFLQHFDLHPLDNPETDDLSRSLGRRILY